MHHNASAPAGFFVLSEKKLSGFNRTVIRRMFGLIAEGDDFPAAFLIAAKIPLVVFVIRVRIEGAAVFPG